MKKNILITFILLFFCMAGITQNLVPNPSFENYTVCPDNYYMLPTDWYTCSADPDYFNECDTTNAFGVPTNGFGYQQAADGRAYCGFGSLSFAGFKPYKEYLGCCLLYPLIIGNKYYISFKVSFAGGPGYNMATNNIGLLFSTVSFQDYQPYDTIWGIPTINFAHVNCTSVISDSQNWTAIKGSIIADSAYQYILIGNFFDVAHTDTVLYSVYPIQQKAYYYVDKVCVSTDSIECNSPDKIQDINFINNEVNIFPNPVNNTINIKYLNPDLKIFKFILYDAYGRVVKQITAENSTNIDVSECIQGMYLLQLINNKQIINKKLIIQNF